MRFYNIVRQHDKEFVSVETNRTLNGASQRIRYQVNQLANELEKNGEEVIELDYDNNSGVVSTKDHGEYTWTVFETEVGV